MKLESPAITLPKTQKDIFEFLCEVRNFERLMPENNAKFEVISKDSFRFALKGMPEITLKKKDIKEFDTVVFGAGGGKIDFLLTGKIEAVNAENSRVQLFFEGDFNPMMAMMIKGPIGKFLETLIGNMKKAVNISA